MVTIPPQYTANIKPLSFFFFFSWIAKLLVTPSKLVLFTGIGLLSVCFFILLIILALHLKEKVS